MDPNDLLPWMYALAPTLVAGFMAGVLALQCSNGLTAFLTGLLLTVILAPSLAAGVDHLQIGGGGWSANSGTWKFHLMISPFLGVPLGAFCAALVSRRPPPTIRH